MNKKENVISVIYPSRGRQDQLLKMIHSARSFADQPEIIEFCIYVDDDDNSYNLS
jgi:hypothetical protein